jgi:hypothetical protein
MPTSKMSSNLNPLYQALLEAFSSSKLECDDETPKEKMKKELLPLGGEAMVINNDIYDGTNNLITGEDGYVTQGQDSVSAIVEQLKQKIVAYIDILKVGQRFGAYLDQVCLEIVKQLPGFVNKIMSFIAPGVTDFGTAALSIKTALTKALILARTTQLTELAKFPVAGDVIACIRSEIDSATVNAAGRGLFSTLSGIAAVATMGGSSVVMSVVSSVIEMFYFIKGIIDKEKMRAQYRIFIKDCNAMLSKPMSDLIFKQWFSKNMTQMPVLASYVVCMPSFGSPYNFINLVEARTTKPSRAIKVGYSIKKVKSWVRRKKVKSLSEYSQKSTYRAYRELQSEAKLFIKGDLQITSNKPGTMQAFNAARGETNFIPGTDQKAFEDAVKNITRDNMQNGVSVKNYMASQVQGVPGRLTSAVGEGVGELLIPE